MNILDRAIGYLAPNAGLKRAAARASLDVLRNYDGAMRGRRTAGWTSTNASANVALKGALPTLRARSRDVIRNTWWGKRVKSTVVSHAVGAAIMPKPKTGNKALDKRAKRAWKKWIKAKYCDREGQLNFDGLLSLATGCIVESGEVLCRFVPLSLRGDIVPLEIQLLEPDHLDSARDRVTSNDAIVDQGIEYDRNGKRSGYWILPVHPGARGLAMPQSSIRIPADDVLHVYAKDRIGQGRGVPWVAAVLLKGRDIADLEEAVVVKSRIEACQAGIVKTTDASRTLADKVSSEPGQSGGRRRIEAFSPGMIYYLEPGEEFSSFTPSSSIQFESVLKTNWLTLAAGCGITYDQLTGDLTGANFSSLRAGKIEFRRFIEQFQWHTLVAMFLEPLWDRWCDAAMDAGILPRRADGYPCDWIMPANEPIDPLKDMQADVMAVRTGRMTWDQFVSSWGLDPDVQLDEIEAWLKELDKRKIPLDTDPRRPMISPKATGKGKPQAEDDDDD